MPKKEITLRQIVAWMQIATAIAGILSIVFTIKLLLQDGSLNLWAIIFMAFPFIYLAASIGLLKNKRGCWLLSLILQLITVIDINLLDAISWYWSPGLELLVSFNIGGLEVGFDFLAALMISLLLKTKKGDITLHEYAQKKRELAEKKKAKDTEFEQEERFGDQVGDDPF